LIVYQSKWSIDLRRETTRLAALFVGVFLRSSAAIHFLVYAKLFHKFVGSNPLQPFDESVSIEKSPPKVVNQSNEFD